MKINDIEVDEAAVLAVLTDEQKAKLTEAKDGTDLILYKPKWGERYLYFDGVWHIDDGEWSERYFDRHLWDMGFIAPDTSEGRHYLEHRRDQHLAKIRLQRWIAENATEKIDWNDIDQSKYYPGWDTEDEASYTEGYNSLMVNPDGICVASKDVECFLKECESDLKIYFGVK